MLKEQKDLTIENENLRIEFEVGASPGRQKSQELGQEDLASSSDDDLLNYDFGENEKDKEEENLKIPPASPIKKLTRPMAFIVPASVEPSSLSAKFQELSQGIQASWDKP
ncbi:hypothetical protein HAX54_038625 [Datura stramonium]|uniref:Uncharacterized protein n=1 Tax=Datura stramonium TaxID=4076 RepID=A0ABS8SID3_DATST|nr:hypothetical protein [Datura stramonium]